MIIRDYRFFDRITLYPYGASVGKVGKTELLNAFFTLSKYKMINFDDFTNENKIGHNPKWPYISDHSYRILIIIGGSGSKKTKNALLNLIDYQNDIDKIYLYAKDPYEANYQLLINKGEKVDLDYLDDPKAFIEYSNCMQDVYKIIEKYNPGKKRSVLIVFGDMVVGMICNKKPIQ